MTIPSFIETQLLERQALLSAIHELILEADETVEAEISPMMGKEMIIYKADGLFKYGLSSVKNHLSLHLMPIYSVPALYAKYVDLLPNASFQKGCVNFKDENQAPLPILKELMIECSKVDLKAIIKSYGKSKKA